MYPCCSDYLKIIMVYMVLLSFQILQKRTVCVHLGIVRLGFSLNSVRFVSCLIAFL